MGHKSGVTISVSVSRLSAVVVEILSRIETFSVSDCILISILAPLNYSGFFIYIVENLSTLN